MTEDETIKLQLCTLSYTSNYIQGSTNRRAPGLGNFVPALAYHFCLNLPAAFTQPGARLLVEPCTFRFQHVARIWVSGSIHIQSVRSDNYIVERGTRRHQESAKSVSPLLQYLHNSPKIMLKLGCVIPMAACESSRNLVRPHLLVKYRLPRLQ